VTEDEALAQLRDIHLPAGFDTATSIQFAAWPFIAVTVVVGMLLAIRLWNRNRWQRRAQTDLSNIVQTEDRSAQWSQLLAFAKSLPLRTRRKVNLPSFAYRRPETITDAERAAFIDFVSAELRR
jgi:hypothetical protein